MPDVASWLAELGLEKYAKDFDDVEIDFETLPELTEEDLRELGLPLGPKRKIWAAIQRLSSGLKEQSKRAFASVKNGDDITPNSEGERRQLTQPGRARRYCSRSPGYDSLQRTLAAAQ